MLTPPPLQLVSSSSADGTEVKSLAPILTYRVAQLIQQAISAKAFNPSCSHIPICECHRILPQGLEAKERQAAALREGLESVCAQHDAVAADLTSTRAAAAEAEAAAAETRAALEAEVERLGRCVRQFRRWWC